MAAEIAAAIAWNWAEAAVNRSRYVSLLRESGLLVLEFDLRVGVTRSSFRILRRVHAALRENCLGAALRQIDRAWRSHPEDAEALAPIYARLLAFEERNQEATLRLL